VGDHTHDCPVCGRPFTCHFFQDCSRPRQVICFACWRARKHNGTPTPTPPMPPDTDWNLLAVLVGMLLFLYDHGLPLLRALWTPAPVGRTLRARYPPAPGAFVTSYSSIELSDEALVAAPRRW